MSMEKLPHAHGEANGRFCEELGEDERFSRVAELFKLLSDPTRIRLFWLLCHTEQCVINLSVMLGVSESALSHHLKLLRTSGLLVSRREGKEVYYKAADTEEGNLLHKMAERVMQIACPETEREGTVQKMHAVHAYLLDNMERQITLEELSARFYINPTTLRTIFRQVYGETPTEHMREHRMREAARLLRESDGSIAEIARAVGYDSQSRFSSAFRACFGVLPRDYRTKKGG